MIYYINVNSHEVHRFEGCARQPYGANRAPLGDCGSFSEAIRKAKQMGYSKADRCEYCPSR